MNWLKSLRGKLKLNEPLRGHTSFKIGGPAEVFFEPRDAKDLKLAVVGAKDSGITLRIIGRGTNVLVDDRGVKGMVVRLNSAYFKKVTRNKHYLSVGSGLSLNKLLEAVKGHGLSGIEFLAGIPGTVGGAIEMNAGAWGRQIGDLVEDVEVMDYNGKIKTLKNSQLEFRYRSSNLEKFIILNARLKLKQGEKKASENKTRLYLKSRFKAQDNSFPNAGCIFKNPNADTFAGRLIDSCGLKGKAIGGAAISRKHANFILNRANAGSDDILSLMKIIQDRVRKKFEVKLQPEIKIWK
jgi:UDP-N-acetylmuramate dehydrogenase